MFQWYTDEFGNNQCYMLPYFDEYFNGLLGMIEQMQTTTGKWTEEEVQKYYLFLKDLKQYIVAYIFTAQVWDFNAFQNAMITYGQEQNPIGYELYNHQIEYLTMRAEGKNFKL